MYTKAIRKIYKGKKGYNMPETYEKAVSSGYDAFEFNNQIYICNSHRSSTNFTKTPFTLDDFEVK